MGSYEELPEDLIRFRILTATILLAIVGEIAGSEFWDITHASQIILEERDWLDCVAMILDRGMNAHLSFSDAAVVVAIIHCAAEARMAGSEPMKPDSKIIGSRKGVFAGRAITAITDDDSARINWLEMCG
jgi:hypothetical protein